MKILSFQQIAKWILLIPLLTSKTFCFSFETDFVQRMKGLSLSFIIDNIPEKKRNHKYTPCKLSRHKKKTIFSLFFFQVVELLLARGANKEHRNVSDYTPLSLAASGGYVNIIKILLNAGAEINSR